MNVHESDMVLENGVRGTYVRPRGEGRFPAVLLLHGFASDRHEVGRLYAKLADALAGRSIASLRIDFRGWGESPGDMADTTAAGQIEDARLALQALRGDHSVHPERIGLVGFSLGASIAMHTAADHDSSVRSLVLWSATHTLRDTFMAEMGAESFAAAARAGIVTVDLGWRTVTLKQAFFEGLAGDDPSLGLAGYRGALLAAAGSEDGSARSLDALYGTARGNLRATWLIPGADHVFNVLGPDPAIGRALVDTTAAWLAMTL
jgi:uncharacterized protein